MALIKWTKELSVNISSIDEQHKILINMINEFYEKIREKSNNELISDLITKMKDYTILHFSVEEKLFEQYNYADFEQHKKQHDGFIKKVSDLEERFNKGEIILSFEITKFLKDWLINHIQGTDKKYTKFFIEKGIS